MSYIVEIATANPQHRHKQEDVSAFFSRSLEEADTAPGRKIKAVAGRSGIEGRYSVLPDFSLAPEAFTFFGKEPGLEPLPGLNERMSVFRREALSLSLSAVRSLSLFESVRNNITHLITVTCTGLYAPGLDVELMRDLGLDRRTFRSSVNFMGCNAAILAMRQAHQIIQADPRATVLVVCTELCTIHFQKNFTDDYILSNLLFSDGSAAMLISGRPAAGVAGLRVESFSSAVLHEGSDHMAWHLSEKGFIMTLSALVPSLIRDHFRAYVEEAGAEISSVDHWAIHPGGKSILDATVQALGVDRGLLRESYDVLSRYGNMSSPTIIYVLRDLMRAADPGSRTFAAAFGPGITIESVTLSHV